MTELDDPATLVIVPPSIRAPCALSNRFAFVEKGVVDSRSWIIMIDWIDHLYSEIKSFEALAALTCSNSFSMLQSLVRFSTNSPRMASSRCIDQGNARSFMMLLYLICIRELLSSPLDDETGHTG